MALAPAGASADMVALAAPVVVEEAAILQLAGQTGGGGSGIASCGGIG